MGKQRTFTLTCWLLGSKSCWLRYNTWISIPHIVHWLDLQLQDLHSGLVQLQSCLCISGMSHHAAPGCCQWAGGFSGVRKLPDSGRSWKPVMSHLQAEGESICSPEIVTVVFLQYQSELELSVQQQNRLNEVIRAITQVTTTFFLVCLLASRLAMKYRCTHKSALISLLLGNRHPVCLMRISLPPLLNGNKKFNWWYEVSFNTNL